MKRSAFTLIELLVVIAVIALLLAILLPALSSARETGKSAKCLANLHNIGLAVQAYFNISDDLFPLSQAHGGYQPGDAWLDTLEPYTDSKLQYLCPSDRTPNLNESNPALRRATSYGINIFTGPLQDDWFPNNPVGIPPFGHRSFSRLGGQSASIVFAAELAEFDVAGQPVYPDHFHPEGWRVNPGEGDPSLDPQFSLAIWRHLGRSNYLYADGHAERRAFEQTFFVSPDGAKLLVNQYDPGFPYSLVGWYQ